MRNRLLPLGYRTENGIIVIDEKEAEIVKSIFRDYCSGKSLKTLVNSLNESNASFKENGVQWNKGRIHHILVDRRYIGEKSFPIIIDVAIFDKANGLKDDKRVNKRPITAEAECLKDKVFCDKCGAKYIRIIDSDKKRDYNKSIQPSRIACTAYGKCRVQTNNGNHALDKRNSANE